MIFIGFVRTVCDQFNIFTLSIEPTMSLDICLRSNLITNWNLTRVYSSLITLQL